MRIDDEKIAELKAQYNELYLTSIDLDDVIFKALTVGEYRESLRIVETESSVDAEEYLLGVAVLEPSDFDLDHYSIGAVTSLADEVLEKSGFSDLEVCVGKINKGRQEAEELISFMKAMIIASNQQYSAEQIDDMTFADLAKCCALAERIFEIQSTINRGEQVILEVTSNNEEAQAPRPADLSPDDWAAIQRGEYANPEKSSTIGAAGVDDPIARKLKEALG